MQRRKVAWKGATADRRIASFRYRIEAPIKALRARGHEVEHFDPEAAQGYHTVVFSKAYSAADLALAHRLTNAGVRVIFDLCDNHFFNPNRLPRYEKARGDILAMISAASLVTCSTPSLAQVVQDASRSKIAPRVVGDIAERTAASERKPAAPGERLDLLWYGSHGSPNAPGGMEDLRIIRRELEALAEESETSLTVLSNNRSKFNELVAPMALPTRYVEWSRQAQIEEISAADAVVIPIGLNPFTACKTHNRLTTALYMGTPVLATTIESYEEFARFCTLDDWSGGLSRLIDDLPAERERAATSRPYIDAHWSAEAIAPMWEDVLELSMAASPQRQQAAERRSLRTAAPRYQGRLDAVAATAITGWVRDLADPDHPVEVAFEADGEVVAVAVADLPRDDLRNSRLANPDCGFAFSLHGVAMADPAGLKVKVASDGWVVGEGPIVVSELRDDNVLFQTPPSPPERPREALGVAAPTPDARSLNAQARLEKDVEAFDRLLAELRGVLARSLVATAESPLIADRLRNVLGGSSADRSAKPTGDGEPWSDLARDETGA